MTLNHVFRVQIPVEPCYFLCKITNLVGNWVVKNKSYNNNNKNKITFMNCSLGAMDSALDL